MFANDKSSKPPAGKQPAGFWWDPELKMWRQSFDDLLPDVEEEIPYGKADTEQRERTGISITVSKLKGDVPSSYLQMVFDFFVLICLKVNVSIEEGEKEGNKHVQGYGELFLTRGKEALAALAKALKEHLMISVQDSIKICIKRVTEVNKKNIY